MTKAFSASKIELLRRKAGKAAERPDDVQQGWSISTVDPMAVLAVFRPLHIKEGYALRAYQFRAGGNGNGFVWAMPIDAEFPEPKECPKLEGTFLEPPKPLAALNDLMVAIDGDESHWSYMCASILARELADFGAMWHGCDWGTHAVLGRSPWSVAADKDGAEPMGPLTDWIWAEPSPKRWSPRVSEDDKAMQVTFHTYSGLGQEAIYRHVDNYLPGTYQFKSERERIARGPGGFVF